MAEPIKVNFRGEIRVDVDVDLVAYFTRLPEQHRASYWDHTLHEYGFDEEWERPISYVLGDLDSDTSLYIHGPGFQDSTDGVEWDDVARGWTEADFDRLCAEVPWLRLPEEEDDEEREHRLARIPGPYDVPLPLGFGPGAAPAVVVGTPSRDVPVRGDLL